MLPFQIRFHASTTHRNPMLPVAESGVLELRAPTRYRLQYDSWQRYEPPRMTRDCPLGGPVGLSRGPSRWKDRVEPVCAPLPHIARHVAKAVAVGFEGGCGRGAVESRRPGCFWPGTPLARCCIGARRRVSGRRPTRTGPVPARRAQRTPTRPRWAGVCPTTRRIRWHRSMRRGPRGGPVCLSGSSRARTDDSRWPS